MKLLGGGFHVSQLAVKRREVGAQADDDEIYSCTSLVAAIFLNGADHHASEPFALLSRVDREHAEIAAVSFDLDVHGCRNFARAILRDEKLASFHHLGQASF